MKQHKLDSILWLSTIVLASCTQAGEFQQSSAELIGGLPDAPSDPELARRHRAYVRLTIAATDGGYGTYATGNCGGVLVTPRHVLTAAHCVYRGSTASNAQWSISVAFNKEGLVRSASKTSSGVLSGNCFLHPNANAANGGLPGEQCFTSSQSGQFQDTTNTHDIAIIELSQPVSRADVVPAPVALSNTQGMDGLVSGMSLRLNGVSSDYYSILNATNYATARPYMFATTTAVFSGGTSTAGSGATGGDSGSPFFWKRSAPANSRFPLDDREFVVGLLGTYSVITRTANPWLEQHMLDPNASQPRWLSETEGVARDNCPGVINPDQIDSDGDGRGDACDLCPGTSVLQGDDPVDTQQRNCNARVELVNNLAVLGDACDPHPCNTLDGVNVAASRGTDHGIGTRCTRASVNTLICNNGDIEPSFAFAPRIGDGHPQQDLVSPLRRCACWMLPMQGPPVVLSDAECLVNEESNPCKPRIPTSGGVGGGFGWHVADLSIPSNTIPVGAVRDVPAGYSYNAAYLPYAPAPSYFATVVTFRSLANRIAWPWDRWWDATRVPAPIPFPTSFPLDTGPTNATPGRVTYMTRAQTTNLPSTPLEQALQDHYLPATRPLVLPWQSVMFSPVTFDRWWRIRRPRWLFPSQPAPGPDVSPRAAYVSRSQMGVAVLDQSISGVTGSTWKYAPTNSPVRGIAPMRLNVRTAQVLNVAMPGSEPVQDLPIFGNASYAMGSPVLEGWAKLVAFGGRDANGVAQDAVFVAAPVLGSDFNAQYTWHRFTTDTGPSPRWDASAVVTPDETRLIVAGGRNSTGMLNDVWQLEFATGHWTALTLSKEYSPRSEAAVSIRGNVLYLAGGRSATDTFLSDLIEIQLSDGATQIFEQVVPKRATAQLSFDDHGDGIVFAGGYDETGWKSDVWLVHLFEQQVQSFQALDFSASGLVTTEGFAVVVDFAHQLAWGIPGYSANEADAQGVWFTDVLTTTVVQPGGDPPGGTLLRSVAGSTSQPVRGQRPRVNVIHWGGTQGVQ